MKLAFFTLQEVHKGFITYLTIFGHAQTINESNDFDEFVVKTRKFEAYHVENSVLLNHSTHGVLC